MKTLSSTIRAILIPAVLLSIATYFSSCKEDEVFPPPAISLSATTASSTAGQKISTTVIVESPAGGSTLTILVNGAADPNLPNVDLAGEVTVEKLI